MSEDNNIIEDKRDELRRELERWDDESLDEREMVINSIKKEMDNDFIIELTQVSEEEIESI